MTAGAPDVILGDRQKEGTGHMGMHATAADSMTIEEFYAFTDASPDRGKWELIRGEPILNPAPTPLHQLIVVNITTLLANHRRATGASWYVLPGLGVEIASDERPEPDVVVVPELPPDHRRHSDKTMVAVEVLSPSTKKRDLNDKRIGYASLPSLTDYVVIAQDAVHVIVFARDNGFEKRELTSLDDVLRLPSIGAELALRDIYQDTGL